MKNRLASDEQTRELEPFSFTHTLTEPLTAFATRGRNDAGKSSVLEMILWAVRGVADVAVDVRAWTRHVLVALRVGEDDVLVAWTITGQEPAGLIITLPDSYDIDWAALDEQALKQMREDADGDPQTEAWDDALNAVLAAGGVINARFSDAGTFQNAVSAFMSERLGFERLDVFRKNNNASDNADGGMVTHSWPLWSQALVIPKKTITTTLGSDPATAAFVMETYLGTTWGPAKAAAHARWMNLDAETASARRAFRRDDEQQRGASEALQQELNEAFAERAGLPELNAIDELDRASADLSSAASELADAEVRYADALALAARLRGEVAVAEADRVAIREAALTDKFWHALKPSCCPRCDAQVDAARWAREDDGQCSLCDSPLDLTAETATTVVATVDDGSDDDSTDEQHLVDDRVDRLVMSLTAADTDAESARSIRDELRGRVAELRTQITTHTVNPATVRALELRIATLQARIDERSKTVVRADDLARVDHMIAVLKATEKEAERLRGMERGDLLDAVSSHLVELGKRLGFRELEEATLKGNGHLPVVKGGERANFGDLTDGEKLRMKIAVVIALLRVGSRAGVGRHPGLLVIDSPASEEMDHDDVRQMMAELARIAEETGLQVIASSANAELMLDILKPAAVREPRPGQQLLW
ncbi:MULTISPECIES: hypothetical protein [unclassified Curtobacterium]|uniref:hypothetical protein n=2 Tax=Curtobacterium TaxID=2034 RepID=UPI000DA8B28A|nr:MULTISPECIES: hypothetical protein [unclassified Curtobacterium]PZE60345.1 hypothetical protein DEJ24_06385 [Curtobacterium sp. MCPF17_001]